MRSVPQKRMIAILVILSLILTATLSACARPAKAEPRLRPEVVILPMFEIGALSGDDPGEAQLYYEAYFSNPTVYELTGEPAGCSFYLQDGVGLCLLGQGKASAAVNLTALLCDERFDFSDTIFLATGCAGTSEGSGVVGDVYLITSTVDYDLGYTADPRDLADEADSVWYRIGDYDSVAYQPLNSDLAERAFALIRDLPLETTEDARACMARNFDSADWAVRDPEVRKGASVTSDSYWKGEYSHQRAIEIAESYATPGPYAVTEMEDAAVALAFAKMGLLDHLLILRAAVNLDVFLDGATPESLWGGGGKLFDNGFDGFTDIFPVAMQNCFAAGSVLIDAARSGSLK